MDHDAYIWHGTDMTGTCQWHFRDRFCKWKYWLRHISHVCSLKYPRRQLLKVLKGWFLSHRPSDILCLVFCLLFLIYYGQYLFIYSHHMVSLCQRILNAFLGPWFLPQMNEHLYQLYVCEPLHCHVLLVVHRWEVTLKTQVMGPFKFQPNQGHPVTWEEAKGHNWLHD